MKEIMEGYQDWVNKTGKDLAEQGNIQQMAAKFEFTAPSAELLRRREVLEGLRRFESDPDFEIKRDVLDIVIEDHFDEIEKIQGTQVLSFDEVYGTETGNDQDKDAF